MAVETEQQVEDIKRKVKEMRFVYPKGKEKALTLSYDDGQIFDRRLVEILNKYGIKGTFHLNSAHLFDGQNYPEHVSRAEVKELYAGHEVACHGENHYSMFLLNDQRALMEVLEDRRKLESLTGKMVQGMSYAFGHCNKNSGEVLKMAGIKYSRKASTTGTFYPPGDFMEWEGTCHHEDNLADYAQEFLHVPSYVELPLMYVWGHSFEFDRNNNWELIEDFARTVSGREEIWYATNLEIYEYLTAIRRLEYSADGLTVYNPTLHTVWYKNRKGIHTIEPGQTVYVGKR